MNMIKKLALPMMVAGTIGMTMPSQAEPTIIPAYQVAQANNNAAYNGVAKDNERPGMDALDDNVQGPADRNDADPSTFDATFWVLMALLAVGVVAMIIVATRRRATAH